MAGYANRVVRLPFDEFSESGDEVYLDLLNPRAVSYEDLRPQNVAYDAQGNAIDPDQFRKAMYEVYAGLIVGGHVYDARVKVGDQPLLAIPMTGEVFSKLPSTIQDAVVEEVNKRRNPTPTPTTSS